MKLYSLTEKEITIIDDLNAQRDGTLLIVCDHGEYIGVDPDALQQSKYSIYLDALGGEFDEDRVVEFTPKIL